MGHQLARPVTTKTNQACGVGNGFRWATSSMQGYRADLEDVHLVQQPFVPSHPEWTLFAVFDGHGGTRLVEKARELMVPTLLEDQQIQQVLEETRITGGMLSSELAINSLKKGLSAAFLRVDTKLLEWSNGVVAEAELARAQSHPQESEKERKRAVEKAKWLIHSEGTTFVGVLLTPGHLFFINCGDSRAFLSQWDEEQQQEQNREDKIAFSTKDHTNCGHHLGDFKGKIDYMGVYHSERAVPDVSVVERHMRDEFIVLACDGIFDVFENGELRDLIRSRATGNRDLFGAVEQVLDVGIAWEHRKKKHDNMSLLVIAFGNSLLPDQTVVEHEAAWLKQVEEVLLGEYMAEFNYSNSLENYEERVKKTDFEKLSYVVDEKESYEAHPSIELVPDPRDMMRWLVEERQFPPPHMATDIESTSSPTRGGLDLAQVAINAILEPKIAEFHRTFAADKAAYGRHRGDRGGDRNYRDEMDASSANHRAWFKRLQRIGPEVERLELNAQTNVNLQRLLAFCSPEKLEELTFLRCELNDETLRRVETFTKLTSLTLPVDFEGASSVLAVNNIFRTLPIDNLKLESRHTDGVDAWCGQMELPTSLKFLHLPISSIFNSIAQSSWNRMALGKLRWLTLDRADELTPASLEMIKTSMDGLRCLYMSDYGGSMEPISKCLFAGPPLPYLRTLELDFYFDLNHLPALVNAFPNLEHLKIQLLLPSAQQQEKAEITDEEEKAETKDEEEKTKDSQIVALLLSSLCALSELRSLHVCLGKEFELATSQLDWLRKMAGLRKLEWVVLKGERGKKWVELDVDTICCLIHQCKMLRVLGCSFKSLRHECEEVAKRIAEAVDEVKSALPEEERHILHMPIMDEYPIIACRVLERAKVNLAGEQISKLPKSHVLKQIVADQWIE